MCEDNYISLKYYILLQMFGTMFIYNYVNQSSSITYSFIHLDKFYWALLYARQ